MTQIGTRMFSLIMLMALAAGCATTQGGTASVDCQKIAAQEGISTDQACDPTVSERLLRVNLGRLERRIR